MAAKKTAKKGGKKAKTTKKAGKTGKKAKRKAKPARKAQKTAKHTGARAPAAKAVASGRSKSAGATKAVPPAGVPSMLGGAPTSSHGLDDGEE